jgi:hypothetical protein
MMGVALDRASRAGVRLALCALLLIAFVVAGLMLAPAVSQGLSDAPLPAFHWTWLLPAALAGIVWTLERRGRRLAAVYAIAVATTASIAWIKLSTLDDIDRLASARTLAREIAPRAADTCLDAIKRDWAYGLAYYLRAPLPDCAVAPRPLRVHSIEGQPPQL